MPLLRQDAGQPRPSYAYLPCLSTLQLLALEWCPGTKTAMTFTAHLMLALGDGALPMLRTLVLQRAICRAWVPALVCEAASDLTNGVPNECAPDALLMPFAIRPTRTVSVGLLACR